MSNPKKPLSLRAVVILYLLGMAVLICALSYMLDRSLRQSEQDCAKRGGKMEYVLGVPFVCTT